MINKLDFSSSGLLSDSGAVADTEASLGGDRQLFAALLSGALPEAAQGSGVETPAAQAVVLGEPMEVGVEVTEAASLSQLESGLETGIDAVELEFASPFTDLMMSVEPRAAQQEQLSIPDAIDSDIALPGLKAERLTPQIMSLSQQIEGRAADLVEAQAATQSASLSPEPATTSEGRAASADFVVSLTDSDRQQLSALTAPLLRRSDTAGSGTSTAGTTTPEVVPFMEDTRNFPSGADDTSQLRGRAQADQARLAEPSNASFSGLAASPFAEASDLIEVLSGEPKSGNSVDPDGDLVMLRAPSSVQNSTELPSAALRGREHPVPIVHASASDATMSSSQPRSELTRSLFEIGREASSTWLRETGLQGTAQVQPGGGRILLQLHPAELGYLEIDILSQDSAASIEFISQNAGTRDLIEQSLPRLRELLQEQGLELSGLQVRSEGREQRGQPQHERSHNSQDLEVSQLNDSILPTAASVSARDDSSVLDVYA